MAIEAHSNAVILHLPGMQAPLATGRLTPLSLEHPCASLRIVSEPPGLYALGVQVTVSSEISRFRMAEELQETYIRQLLEANPAARGAVLEV